MGKIKKEDGQIRTNYLKKNTYTVVFSIIFLLIGVLLYLVFLKKNKIEQKIWTDKNSLSKTSIDVFEISDNINDIDKKTALINALDNSLIYLNKKNKEKKVNFGQDVYTIKDVINSLEDFKQHLIEYGLSEKFTNYVKDNFIIYKSNAKKILFTGYYEAQLFGAYKRDEYYKYPVYKKPDDLVKIDISKFYFYKKGMKIPRIIRGRLVNSNTIVPFYSRTEIDTEGKLKNSNLEIIWVNDPIDLFFLQIQGSGVVEMKNGDTIRLNYSESNGHPYRAIGRYLVNKGYLQLKDVSMQSIRKFLNDNPDKLNEIFNYNPSYVFFRTVKEGPIGSIGVPLTAYRSIATDRHIFPKGAICFIETKLPVFDEQGKIVKWEKFCSFVMNQDTGGAIRTPGRVDLFTGFGKSAELSAGHLKQNGKLFFLIKSKF